MTDSAFGGCRHCGHTPVHSSARACPYCGGIAPYTRTPPRRRSSLLMALIGLSLLAVIAAVYFYTMRG